MPKSSIEKPRVYIAGPIRGDGITPSEVSTKAAIDIADKLASEGMIPFVPHLSLFWNFLHHRGFQFWIDYDFEWIKQCHVLFRMSGYSEGADMEVKLAKSLGIPVYYDAVFNLLDDFQNQKGPVWEKLTQKEKKDK